MLSCCYALTFQFIRQQLHCFRRGPGQTGGIASDNADSLIAVHTFVFVFRPANKLKGANKEAWPSSILWNYILYSSAYLFAPCPLPLSTRFELPQKQGYRFTNDSTELLAEFQGYFKQRRSDLQLLLFPCGIFCLLFSLLMSHVLFLSQNPPASTELLQLDSLGSSMPTMNVSTAVPQTLPISVPLTYCNPHI